MYTTPEIELIALSVEDIIVTSAETVNPGDDNKTPDDEL